MLANRESIADCQEVSFEEDTVKQQLVQSRTGNLFYAAVVRCLISRLGMAIVQYRSVRYPKFIVVVGTSAGGRNALIEFVNQLKIDMNAAFFIVMHLSKRGLGEFLVRQLQPYTPLPCDVAKDDASIEVGHIYLSPSNGHFARQK